MRIKEVLFKLWVIIPLTFAGSCTNPADHEDYKKNPGILKEVFKASLKNDILNVWYPASIDSVNGGFLADFNYKWIAKGSQDKMIVTQARHVWTASQAFLFFNDSSYFKIARHGYNFLLQKMWDNEFGGFYTIRNAQGNPLSNTFFDEKTAYGNAFAIYALTGYYTISGDSAALNLAVETFNWLEKHSYDTIHKGYFDKMLRDGTLYTESNSDLRVIELRRKRWKDYNSSIHLLEAFSELYKIWPDSLLYARTIEMLHIVRDTLTDSRGFLKMHFENDWSHVSYRDSARNVLQASYYFDHVSFGHDVETAYLMLEASDALDIHNDTLTPQTARKLVDHALSYGWDTKNGGFYDMGYYFAESKMPSTINKSKTWWTQAEGLNSLLLMAIRYPNEPEYFNLFLKQWNYIDKYLIDHKNGEWYFEGLDNSPGKKIAPKATIWKINYHNVRALINCIKMLDEYKQAKNPNE